MSGLQVEEATHHVPAFETLPSLPAWKAVAGLPGT